MKSEHLEFKQKLAIALASNPEFVKRAAEGYDRKQIWFSLSRQVTTAANEISNGIAKECE